MKQKYSIKICKILQIRVFLWNKIIRKEKRNGSITNSQARGSGDHEIPTF